MNHAILDLCQLYGYVTIKVVTALNITYKNKKYCSSFTASSVIRMAQHFLTFDIFKKGLRLYLEEK